MATAGWAPAADNYLGRVTKARILEAVREAKGDVAAQLINHLKKPDRRARSNVCWPVRAGCPSPFARRALNPRQKVSPIQARRA